MKSFDRAVEIDLERDMPSTAPDPPKQTSGSKWRPAHGPTYEISDHAIIEAKTRSWIAKAFVGSGIVALAIAGVASLISGKPMFILSVWGVVGPLFGAISGYYFKSDRKDPG